jgi:hypothetical protein
MNSELRQTPLQKSGGITEGVEEITEGRRNSLGRADATTELPATIVREPPNATTRENQRDSTAASLVRRQPR